MLDNVCQKKICYSKYYFFKIFFVFFKIYFLSLQWIKSIYFKQ